MRLLTVVEVERCPAAENFARSSNWSLFAIALPTTAFRKCPR